MKEANKTFYVILALVLFAMFMLDIVYPKGTIIIFFNQFYSEFYNTVFQWVTKFGETASFALLPIIFVRSKRDLLLYIGLIATLAIVALGLKSLFGQPRPYVYFWQNKALHNFEFIESFVNKSAHSSFPSGHTMSAFTLYTYVAINYLKKISYKTIFLFIALAVGLSRIYLFQHFFHDVFMGAFCGIFIAIILSEIRQKIVQK